MSPRAAGRWSPRESSNRRLLGLLGLVALALTAGVSGCGSQGDETTQAEVSTPAGTASTTSAPITAPPSTTTPSTESEPTSGTGPSVEPGSYRGTLRATARAQYPHDETAFTQGLEWYGDQLLETTGLWGESTVRLVDPRSGEVTQVVDIDNRLFAEGTTVVDDRAYVLTWQDQTLLTVELPTLSPAGTETEAGAYSGEGWGLCHDGASFVMSNGSDELVFRDPETFEVERSVEVTLDGEPVASLNELECIGDQVLANVWKSNTIVVIATETGEVVATIDATSLVPDGYADAGDDVLNGIAFNPETGTLWLTGKRWPLLYEVDLVVA